MARDTEGAKRTINVGEMVRDDDPVVTGRETLFDTQTLDDSAFGPGAVRIKKQEIGFADLVPLTENPEIASGPRVAMAEGDLLVGFSFVIAEDFDDSSGPSTLAPYVIGPTQYEAALRPFKPVQAGNEAWDSGASSGFFGRGEAMGWSYRYLGASPGYSTGNRSLVPSTNEESPSILSPHHLQAFPVEFSTAAEIALISVDTWGFDGTAGLLRLYLHLCTPDAA